MPFTKTGKDEYTSPSGHKMTRKQVAAYKKRMGSNNPNSRRQRERRSSYK